MDASGEYIEWLVKEKKVFGYTLRGKWIDIGDFEALRLAEKEVKENNFSYFNNRTNWFKEKYEIRGVKKKYRQIRQKNA